MTRASLLVAAVVPVVVLAAACKEDPPPATPIAPAQVVGQPAPSAYPADYQQQGYQQPGYTPTAPAGSTPPGQMATPGPTALACSNDSQCMTHRCNLQHQKCAFPCVSDADCIQGTTCFVAGGPTAICMPKPGP
ncbi:MAG: hypothetical protein KIT84_22910 [Labilithrix sp.]|nr:hypothetical protein [Labilithrix sp.]MCW5813896.1 hypothetical protein [Labilithrix sp.]